jgi:hypothetical protein
MNGGGIGVCDTTFSGGSSLIYRQIVITSWALLLTRAAILVPVQAGTKVPVLNSPMYHTS